MSKGISPFIAMIILIAAVVSVSLILILWGKGFTLKLTKQTTTRSEEVAKSRLVIDHVGAQEIIVSNLGANTLHNFSIWIDGEKYEIYSGPNELNPGESGAFELANWIPVGQHRLMVEAREIYTEDVVSVAKQVVIEANVTTEI